MLSAYRFRLYPTEGQEKVLSGMLETARRLWNVALGHRKRNWELHRKSISYTTQQWILTEERKHDPELAALYSQVAQDVLNRLDKTFDTFFTHTTRYPKFKKFRESGSITYPQAYNGSVKLENGKLHLSKTGDIPVVIHRDVPESGLKTCTIRHNPDGTWYASLVYEDENPVPPVPTGFASPVGIDLGLKSLIATSDGKKIPHPRFLRKAEKRLKRLQRRFDKAPKGSKSRDEQRLLLAKQHSKIARQRMDFNQKLTTDLVKNHDLLSFEDLQVRNMVRNHSLAKSIQDAGWGQLVRFSEYKTERAGKLLVKVPPAYSSQECFFCGAINNIGLDVREFACVGCRRNLDRDLNASGITLKRGIAKVGQDKVARPQLENLLRLCPNSSPKEMGPTPALSTVPASPVNDEGTTLGGISL